MAKKKNFKNLLLPRKGKAPYFIGVGLALIVAGLLVFASGYGQSSDNTSSFKPILKYFGILDSSASDEEKQEYIQAFIAENEGISDGCEILYFYNHQCSACQRLEPWLTGFKVRYPEVQITSYELREAGARPLFNTRQRQYGVDSLSVPVMFMCGSVLMGIEPIQTALEPMAFAVYNLESRENMQMPVRSPLEVALT
jgi:hypothetical protein